MFSLIFKCFYVVCLILCVSKCTANDILGCGGFVKSHISLDFSKIEIGLYTKSGSLKEKTECAPTNGYYFLPLYEKGEYVLKIHPPAGWSFQPEHVDLFIDGTTDHCSTGQDINFVFNGFGITGTVNTQGLQKGPAGVKVTLSNSKAETRHTTTSVGGHFHFTPVHPDTYTLTAAHPRWKLNPSSTKVSVREGNTILPTGQLSVSGYDVSGTVVFQHNSHPVLGVYVLLYSKKENPLYRVEGCQTALLQEVPDAPICYSITDAEGKFTFGVVPAGEYKLLALRKSPTTNQQTYNFKPEYRHFIVKHDSLFIDRAFELLSISVSGVLLTHTSGTPVRGARVLLSESAVASTDESGKYTLNGLSPGTYTVNFEHEHCKIEAISIAISQNGLVSVPPARAVAWRVCGLVEGETSHTPTVAVTNKNNNVLKVAVDEKGVWCVYLPSGVYSASVLIPDEDQLNGVHYYPVSAQISVGHGPVNEVKFSQMKATISGSIRCLREKECDNLPVIIQGITDTGARNGEPKKTLAIDGKYSYKNIVSGTVEVSIESSLCWQHSKQVVVMSAPITEAPDFVHTGYEVVITTTHDTQMEYAYNDDKGNWSLAAGTNEFCVRYAGNYHLRPRGCHKFEPEQDYVTTGSLNTPKVEFRGESHAGVITVHTPELIADVVLNIKCETRKSIAPVLKGQPSPAGGFIYVYTIYLKEHEQCTVYARARTVLFSPENAEIRGTGQCTNSLITIRGRPALTLAGKIIPPVAGVTVELTGGNQHVLKEADADGSYEFGPLDATHKYVVKATKESYVFSEPDTHGNIHCSKLAEIQLYVKDIQTKELLQGALVSLSAGKFRRNVMTDESGEILFSGLSPDNYYIKPLMKEYKFSPTHQIVGLKDGERAEITLEGGRVSWSAFGVLRAITGVGMKGALVLAEVHSGEDCFDEEALTEDGGHFRIRGLFSRCEYKIILKDVPDGPELKVFDISPRIIKPEEGKDIRNLRLVVFTPIRLTQLFVLITTAKYEHYKTLRLKLYQEDSTSILYNQVLNVPATSEDNPGVPVILPGLPADNNSYVLRLESTLSKFTHSYEDTILYINSDGENKEVNLEFKPKLRAVEQELEHSSLLVLPLLGLVVLGVVYRHRLAEVAGSYLEQLVSNVSWNKSARPQMSRTEILDQASIHHILNTVNSVGKKDKKKKNN